MASRIEFSINADVPGTVDIEAWLKECVEALRSRGVHGPVGYSWESHGSHMEYVPPKQPISPGRGERF